MPRENLMILQITTNPHDPLGWLLLIAILADHSTIILAEIAPDFLLSR
jgi:hypothetical protein